MSWKRRVVSFEKLANLQVASVDEIQSAATGHTKLRFLDARWKEVEDLYVQIEVNYPEPDGLDLD